MKNLLQVLLPLLFLSNVYATEGMPSGLYVGASWLMSEADEKVKLSEEVSIGESVAIAGSVVTINSATVNELFTDDDDSGWRAFVGYRPHPHFAFELSYLDLGELDIEASGIVHATVDGAAVDVPVDDVKVGKVEFRDVVQLNALANTPLIANRVNFFAKAGLARVNFHLKANGGGRESKKKTTPVLGAGVFFHLTDQIALRAEYDYWDDIGSNSSVDIWSLGVQFRPIFNKQ